VREAVDTDKEYTTKNPLNVAENDDVESDSGEE